MLTSNSEDGILLGVRRQVRVRWVRGRWLLTPGCLLASALIALVARAGAQQPSSSEQNSATPPALHIEVPRPAADGSLPTLHVYTNLMQVPVLVLTSDHQRMKPIPESKFRLRLDSGPPFQPTHVRREGDDPIALAILIDLSPPQNQGNEFLAGLATAVSRLGPDSLRAADRVSVYAMDCGLIRSAYNMPADEAALRKAIETAMQPWKDRQRDRHAAACKPLPLWDVMALVTQQLAQLPGRRVLLTVSPGIDHGSRNNWQQLKKLEQTTSTAVFGLMEQRIEQEPGANGKFSESIARLGIALGLPSGEENPFDFICESSGGLEFTASARSLAKDLQHFTEMLRERYIVEYPRSNDAAAGEHTLEVTVGSPMAYVRPAGISVPMADQKLLADPLTIPSDPPAAPAMGPRPVLPRSPQ